MEIEQLPVTENNEQISAPEPTPSIPSPVIKKAKPFKSWYVIGILLFLVVGLMCGLTYYVLKDRGINLFSGIIEDTSSNEDTNTTDETNNTCNTDSETTNDCMVNLDNSGWALFSLPEYKFSVEIPSYIMTQKLMDQDVQSVWKVDHSTVPITVSAADLFYDNFLHTIGISFYPVTIPYGLGCGAGCVKEHQITVNIFKNTGSKDIAAVVDAYKAKWVSKYTVEDPELVNGLTGSITSKWDTSVWAFTAQHVAFENKGYLIATKDYIYEVTYVFSSDPAASAQIAQKVLDSIKFEIVPETSVSTTYMGDAGTLGKKYVGYDYFLGDYAMKAYLVKSDDITLDFSKIGKKFTLRYQEVAKEFTQGETDYYSIEGSFTYDQQ